MISAEQLGATIQSGVSRETFERLRIYVQELLRWNARINLVGSSTLPDLWRRHIADSAQLAALAEDGRRWVDLGSGAGLPGLVVAAFLPPGSLALIESDERKCAFLRHVAHAMTLAVDIHHGRIADVLPTLHPAPEVVSARALAPLGTLLAMAESVLAAGGVGLFSKGQRYEQELTAARESWTFQVDVIQSRTDLSARILRVRDLQHIRAERPRGGARTKCPR